MRKQKELILQISAILILLSAAAYFFFPVVVPWVMAFAVAFFSYATITSPYPGKSLRGKRLFNFQLLACALFAASAYFMFKRQNEWVVTLIVGAVLLLYASIVLPKELEKEKKN